MRMVAGLLLALAGGPALAAATPDGAVADCRRPDSGAERAICGSAALRASDQQLALLAAEWRQRVPEAAAAQAEWLRRRDRMCAPAMRPDCLEIAYAERAAWLRATLAALPPETPLPQPSEAPAAAPQPVVAMPPPAVATPPPAVVPGVAAASLAARLAVAPCGMVSSTALRAQGWGAADAPFGVALEQWSQPDFTTLARRSRECQAENTDNARNLQLMLNLLNQLRGNAREQSAAPAAAAARQAPPPAPPSAVAEAPQAIVAGEVNCADPALLQDVAFTFQATPAVARGARIRQLLRPRPYSDIILQAYGATPALRTEYQQLRPYMAPLPQCLVEAETAEATLTLSYRLYAEAGRILIEVRRLPE